MCASRKRYMRNLKLLVMPVLGLILLSPCPLHAQKVQEHQIVERGRSGNCEYVAAIVDSFVASLRGSAFLMIISSRGRNEATKTIAEQRAARLRQYITEYHKGTGLARPAEKVISAVNLDSLNHGRMDVYFGGELRLTIVFNDNRMLKLSPCHG